MGLGTSCLRWHGNHGEVLKGAKAEVIKSLQGDKGRTPAICAAAEKPPDIQMLMVCCQSCQATAALVVDGNSYALPGGLAIFSGRRCHCSLPVSACLPRRPHYNLLRRLWSQLFCVGFIQRRD